MTKIYFVLAICVFSLMSFHQDNSKNELTLGKYGVNACCKDAQAVNIIELQLNPDHTFSYIDNSIEQKVKTKGTWTMKNNQLTLGNYPTSLKIHKRWTIDKNAKCLKSRMGMNFRRLCLLKN